MKITEETMRQQALAEAGQTEPPQPSQPPEEPKLSELEKLKAMSWKDRFWYIGAYYKFHILAVFVALFVVSAVGTALYQSTFETALYCFFLNSRGELPVDTAPLEEEFAAYLDLGKKEEIITESGFISFDQAASEYAYAMMAKISALVMAHDLDVVIADPMCIDHYASLDAFLDLETFLPAEVLEEAGARLYYAETGTGEEAAVALDLSGTAFAQASGLQQDPPLLSIISGSQRQDNALALIEYIYTH